MVSTVKATHMAVKLAETWCWCGGYKPYFSSSRAIGFFSRRLQRRVTLDFVLCWKWRIFLLFAPTGSAEPKLGTNPLVMLFHIMVAK